MPANLRYADIPPDREDGSSSWVHTALILTGRLGEVHPILLVPVWAVLIGLAALTWPEYHAWAALGVAVPVLVDWAMLAALPLTHRSWGPVSPPLTGLAFVHALLVAAGGLIASGSTALLALSLGNAAIAAVAIYATWIEPFRVGVTHQRLRLQGWFPAQPVRILHISDIHFEGHSPREQRLTDLVNDLAPDVILLTGDYLNLSSVYDAEAQTGVRELLSELRAPGGVYAVPGSPVVDVPEIVPGIFEGLPIHWLLDDAVLVNLDGHQVWLLGVRNTYQEKRDGEALRAQVKRTGKDKTSILLYHTPDLAPIAAELGIDLYLCGHTHGGQIRLPLYGAIATSSRWGKRFEQGRYQVGGMLLYVCRGLGLEGLGAPRARFLAPPEIVLWEVVG